MQQDVPGISWANGGHFNTDGSSAEEPSGNSRIVKYRLHTHALQQLTAQARESIRGCRAEPRPTATALQPDKMAMAD
jgi:hypothetical protein